MNGIKAAFRKTRLICEGERETNKSFRPHRLGAIIASLATEIDDTRITVGDKAMQEASQVYTHFKTAAKTTPGLEPVALQLDERFRQAKKKRSPMR
uniref:Uncharacterized protein n=1 Tax=Candidatus Kentrum sp. LFY TaxID=2126342 RepID=A0A450X3C5_9GAMM|nr:MAG: hypothetical protein BECKLFY1418C_GA0070996_11533 [Candidatus Kentron sp. LFY]